MIALGIFMLWGCFGFMFMCLPIALLWDKSLTGMSLDGKIPCFTASAFQYHNRLHHLRFAAANPFETTSTQKAEDSTHCPLRPWTHVSF